MTVLAKYLAEVGSPFSFFMTSIELLVFSFLYNLYKKELFDQKKKPTTSEYKIFITKFLDIYFSNRFRYS